MQEAGETATGPPKRTTETDPGIATGFLVGLLVGEGHFGGDGRQPHVTLRMHVRHEAIFEWLQRTFPGGRVYGPYHHGGGGHLPWVGGRGLLRGETAPARGPV